LGADEVPSSEIPKDAFVVYQGHHGDHGAYFADVILPGSAYTEKSVTYVNTEGRAQTTRAAVSPPPGAREDWKIIRALSEVVGKPLGYDHIEELRGRMAQVSPTLVSVDNVETVPFSLVSLGLDRLTLSNKAVGTTPFSLPIKDFYMTNSISRSSSTMAKCSQVFRN
jgi:NADH dehydrogenase (ubiquinone) Fe-S protein 1